MIDINKLKTVEECDTIILKLMQESYKKYIKGKDAAKELVIISKIMKRSNFLKKRSKYIDKQTIKNVEKYMKRQNELEEQSKENFKGI